MKLKKNRIVARVCTSRTSQRYMGEAAFHKEVQRRLVEAVAYELVNKLEPKHTVEREGIFSQVEVYVLTPEEMRQLWEALQLAKDMMQANDLYLPKALDVIEAALAKARGEQ